MVFRWGRAGIFLFFVVIFTICTSAPIFATDIDALSIGIEVYPDGVVKVSEELLLDSTGVNGYVYLPASDPESIILRDDTSDLKFAQLNNFIFFTPNKEKKRYHVHLQYLTSALTSKQKDTWTLELPFPSGEQLDYSSITNAKVTVLLPLKSTVSLTTGQPSLTTTSKKIQIDWKTDFAKSEDFAVSYKFPISTVEKYEWLLLVLVLVLGAALSGIIGYAVFNKYVVSLSKGKKNLLRTLDDNERMIIELLLQEKGKLTQAAIHKKTSISKATLHRAVVRLQKKGIIEIKPRGNVNDILLTEWFQKK